MTTSLPRFQTFTAGPRDGTWVTFVPGIGNDASFWRPRADELSSTMRTLRFEPWGWGESDPAPESCTIEQIADAIAQMWDGLGVVRSNIVGLGFGGSTALQVALRHPDRVERVVACCCRPRLPDDRRQMWRERQEIARTQGFERLADITVERWLSAEFRADHPDVAEELRAAMLRGAAESYSAYVDAFIAMDFSDALATVAAPTLLVAGELDHGGGPVPAMQAMQAAMTDAQLTVIAGSGHICTHEAPGPVSAALREHLVMTGA